jgi:hypothetical protein
MDPSSPNSTIARRVWNRFCMVFAVAFIVFICAARTGGRYVAEHFEVFRRSPGGPIQYVRVTYGYESSQSLLSGLLPRKRVWFVAPGNPSDPILFVVLESGVGRPREYLQIKWTHPGGGTVGRHYHSRDVSRKLLQEATMTLPDGTHLDLLNSRLMYAIKDGQVTSRAVDVRKEQVDHFIRFGLMGDFSLEGLERSAAEVSSSASPEKK